MIPRIIRGGNKRQGPGACDLKVGGFGNPESPTVPRGTPPPPSHITSGILSVDVVDREKGWLPFEYENCLGADEIVDAWFGAGSILFRFLNFALS
jgi:hypothetical protein